MSRDEPYKLLKSLIDIGYDVNQQDEDGCTLLHDAVRDDDIDRVRLLIDSNADVNIKNNDRIMPLHLAVSLQVNDLLLVNGADLKEWSRVNRYNKIKDLIEQGYDVNQKNEDGSTPLHEAARDDDIDLAKLLIDNGANMYACIDDLEEQFVTPLHIAAYNRSLAVLTLLLENGAYANATTKDENTPLHWCVSNWLDYTGAVPIINELILHRAWDRRNLLGETPLHIAAQLGADDAVDALLAGGAEDFIRDYDGNRPDESLDVDGFFMWPSRALKYLIKNVVSEHLQTLLRKRRLLIQTNDYGIVDRNKWDEELKYFITHILAPKLDTSKRYNKWVLRYIEDNRMGGIVRLVEKAVEEASCDFDRDSYRDDMDPIEYEHMCADILSENGWDARITSASGDQGVDVYAEKDGGAVVLQCKMYSSPVGNKAVQEAHAGKGFMGAAIAAVVTNSSYTESARQLAASLDVLLLHHDELGDLSSKLWSLDTQ